MRFCVKAALKLRLSCGKAGFSAGLFKAALKLAFLRSFESCGKAVEKLDYFRKGQNVCRAY